MCSSRHSCTTAPLFLSIILPHPPPLLTPLTAAPQERREPNSAAQDRRMGGGEEGVEGRRRRRRRRCLLNFSPDAPPVKAEEAAWSGANFDSGWTDGRTDAVGRRGEKRKQKRMLYKLSPLRCSKAVGVTETKFGQELELIANQLCCKLATLPHTYLEF